jgi:hypothetical protein
VVELVVLVVAGASAVAAGTAEPAVHPVTTVVPAVVVLVDATGSPPEAFSGFGA